MIHSDRVLLLFVCLFVVVVVVFGGGLLLLLSHFPALSKHLHSQQFSFIYEVFVHSLNLTSLNYYCGGGGGERRQGGGGFRESVYMCARARACVCCHE